MCLRMQVHGFVYFRTPCPMVGNAVYYREMSVENAMAIMLSATNGPDELFLEVLDSYDVEHPSFQRRKYQNMHHISVALFKGKRCRFSSGTAAE